MDVQGFAKKMMGDWVTATQNTPIETLEDGWQVVHPDEAKLRAAGLSEEQIASLDLRNGGNIDDEGNVLYLDDKRLARKEHANQPMYENKPDSTDGVPAMWEFMEQNVMEAKPENWEMVKKEFQTIVALAQAGNPQEPGTSTAKTIELGMGLGGSTHGVMLPLNIDLTDDEKATSTTVPIDLIDHRPSTRPSSSAACRSASAATSATARTTRWTAPACSSTWPARRSWQTAWPWR